ncbi:hypothetical protein [Enterovibrio coralii]|uniref:hypothetical protein n=1 Tax=Enterovibrio coralii TaxID=294935 RepID=UPI002FC305E4
MERILVSACLMGQKVRYNGSDLIIEKSDLDRLGEIAELILFAQKSQGVCQHLAHPQKYFPQMAIWH